MDATVGLLAGRVAVVTGAARGIGQVVAERFVAEGASVVLADLDAEAVTLQAGRLSDASGGRAFGVEVDVADEESVAELARRSTGRFGRVDTVVANAGVLLQRSVVETSLPDWQRVIGVNLTGAFLTCREFARRMVEQGEAGRIILTSSLFGVRGGRDNGAYTASKFGIVGLGQCLAAELAPHGILVNSVCPGQVDTAMMRQLFVDRAAVRGTTPAEAEADLLAKIPIGRMASPAEVADVFVFLASDLSRYVTGQSLVADGGWQVA